MRVASPKLDCPFVRSLVVVQDGTVITSVVLQIAAVDPSLTGSWAVQFFQWYPVTSSSGKSPPIRQRMLEASGIMRGGVGEDMAPIPHLTLFFFSLCIHATTVLTGATFFSPFSGFFFFFFFNLRP